MQVASYPWPTDSLAICGIVAEESRLAGQGGQVPVQEDFMALLTGLPDKSPFRGAGSPHACWLKRPVSAAARSWSLVRPGPRAVL